MGEADALPDRETFIASMTCTVHDDTVWAELYKCNVCGQRWKVGLWWADRSPPSAFKVAPGENWLHIDERALRRDYYIRRDGGLSDSTCIYEGCANRALTGILVCVDHKYFPHASD